MAFIGLTLALVACGKVQNESEPEQNRSVPVIATENVTAESKTEETATNEELVEETVVISEAAEESQELTITMLDVKQGLSILMESAGAYAIYDGGGRESSSYVVSYLKQHNVDHLDYIFVSHYDEDHIAGLVGVLRTIPTDLIIWPWYESDTEIYNSLVNAVEEEGVSAHYPVQDEIYELGDAQIKILYVGDTDSVNDNNKSVIVRVACDDFSCLITGDAEAEEEAKLLEQKQSLKSDIYVVGHHGSSSSSNPEFLDAVNPSVAWISCGFENSYGHPAEETMNTLSEKSINIFRTDKQGEISCLSDGESYRFDQEFCDDWTSGAVELRVASVDDENEEITRGIDNDQEYSYVVNTNTRRFHFPYCRSVSSMKEKNTLYSDATRDELISEGYKPCGNCHP